MRLVILALCGLVLGAGCAPSSGHAGHEGPPDTTYVVRGVYLGPRFDSTAARLEHEDIPGVMPAMTMDFHVMSPATLRGLSEGDSVVFDLDMYGQSSMVSQIAPVGAGP